MCFNAICGRINKQATQMNEAINRVRELHEKKSNNLISYCAACVDYDEENVSPEWPCETIKALDGK